ncbi:MAG TPA: DUF6531 domain-containing protein, partial [Spirochaetia bacterium]|nr:DUF6531 domain-containing protein [Spirochaetia bacterium]
MKGILIVVCTAVLVIGVPAPGAVGWEVACPGGCDSPEPEEPPMDDDGPEGSACADCTVISSELALIAADFRHNPDGTPGVFETAAADLASVRNEESAADGLLDPSGIASDADFAATVAADVMRECDDMHGRTTISAAEIAASPLASRGPTAGDPVRLATGALSFAETDVSYRFHGSEICVRRTYLSDRAGWSSFGPGWSFTYDTRVIRGGAPAAVGLFEAAEAALARVQALLSRDEERSDTLRDEIGRHRAEIIEPRRLRAASLDAALRALRDNARTITGTAEGDALLAQIDSLCSEAATASASYAAMSSTLSGALSGLDELAGPGGALSSARAARDALTELVSELRRNAVLSIDAGSHNKQVLHSGDPPAYTCTGVETAILIDETGVPHLYRFESDPSRDEASSSCTIEAARSGAVNLFAHGARLTGDNGQEDSLRLREDGTFERQTRDGA